MFTESANQLFTVSETAQVLQTSGDVCLLQKARERVFGCKDETGSQSGMATPTTDESLPPVPAPPPVLVLEESPKWHLLGMVLEEVRSETTTDRERGIEEEGEEGEEGERAAGRVLVVVNDERTCYQLKQVSDDV